MGRPGVWWAAAVLAAGAAFVGGCGTEKTPESVPSASADERNGGLEGCRCSTADIGGDLGDAPYCPPGAETEPQKAGVPHEPGRPSASVKPPEAVPVVPPFSPPLAPPVTPELEPPPTAPVEPQPSPGPTTVLPVEPQVTTTSTRGAETSGPPGPTEGGDG